MISTHIKMGSTFCKECVKMQKEILTKKIWQIVLWLELYTKPHFLIQSDKFKIMMHEETSLLS